MARVVRVDTGSVARKRRQLTIGLRLILAGGALVELGQAVTPWGYVAVAFGVVTLVSGFGVIASKERRVAGSATGDRATVVKELHSELTGGLWRYAACMVVFIVAGYLLQDLTYGVLIALGAWILTWAGQFFFAATFLSTSRRRSPSITPE